MAHIHNVIDDDRRFVIDPDTRLISHPSEIPLTLIQYDHNSERFTFELPRKIDGHDMTQCDKVQVHYINVDASNDTVKSASVYEVTDLGDVNGDAEKLAFTWLIDRQATTYVGLLGFAVRFMCTTTKIEADGTTSTIIEYSWNTKPFSGVVISEGMDYSDVIHTNYYDILDTWLNSIDARGDTVMEKLDTHTESLKLDMVASVNAAGGAAKQSITEFAEEVKENLSKQTLESMGVITQETGSATDKVMSQDATTKAIEDAKNFASSEAAAVHSALNAQYTNLEESIGAMETYRRLMPDANGHYKLEEGKLYHICRPENTAVGGNWDVIIACHVRDLSIQTNVGNRYHPGDITYSVHEKLPPYRNRTPDVYGFQMRVLHDGHANIYTDYNAGGVQRLRCYISVEIIVGHDVYPCEELYHDEVITYIDNATHLITGTETYTRNGLYVIDSGAVYEINEDLKGATFTVTANGISDISKTGSSGLTDTYTIVLDDGTTKTFTVTNGDGIKSVTTSEHGEYETTYLVTFDSGATFSFNAPNANAIGIKTPATGTVIHAKDVVSAQHVVKTKVRSKNLIPYPYYYNEQTKDGIAYTFDDSTGEITLNGTASIATSSALVHHSQEAFILKAGKAYTVSCDTPFTGDIGYICVSLYDLNHNNVQTHTVVNRNRNVTFTPERDCYITVGMSIYSGAVFKDGKVKVQLEEGETATDYTPYADVSTVKLTRCGKNMFDPSRLLEGDKWVVSDGVYSGSPASLHAIYGPATGTPIIGQFEPNTQYVFSVEAMADLTESAASALHIRFVYSDNSVDSVNVTTSAFNKYTLTSAAGKTLAGLYLSYNHNVKTYLKNIQLEKGSAATAYEPYSGTEYEIYSTGLPTESVVSQSPEMSIFTDKPGTIIDVVYNIDQTVVYNKFRPKSTRTPLAPGASYVLQPDHMYFIHGYGDNSLQVLNNTTGTNALSVVTAASDIQAMITSNGDGINYGQIFLCHVKDNAVLIYSGTGDANTVSWTPTKIEQIFAPKTKVKNIHATGTAYVYDYGCS